MDKVSAMKLRFLTALGMISLLLVCISYGQSKKKKPSGRQEGKGQPTKVEKGPAGPIPTKEWHSTNGHKVNAEVLEVSGNQVIMKKEEGAEIRVPLSVLIPANQEEILAHFKISKDDLLYSPSNAEQAEGLAFSLGKVHGPVNANGSNYFVYLPKSLKKDREAPLLFITLSGGGSGKKLGELVPMAETLGWIAAISVESSNGMGFKKSMGHTEKCLKHITSTLPINKKRIHYTGLSGGGAMAFNNTTIMPAYGVMPDVAYIPHDITPNTTAVYALSGGNDYNRYHSAFAAEKYGKNGFHRMHNNGHGLAPVEYREDGMFWLQCHGLGGRGLSAKDEKLDFEVRALKWLSKQKVKQPMRAYSNALFMKQLYNIESVHRPVLDALIKELSASKDNQDYHQALLAIDEFSGKNLAPIKEGGGSLFNHNSPKNVKAIESTLIPRFGHLAPLKGILSSMKAKTVAKKK